MGAPALTSAHKITAHRVVAPRISSYPARTPVRAVRVHRSASASPKTTFSAQKSSPELRVHKGGSGSGTVTSDPAGINCGSECSHVFTKGTKVTLTATAASGSYFKGWIANCLNTDRSRLEAYVAPTCDVRVSGRTHAVALFGTGDGTSKLIVSKGGNGSGKITSDPAGINCGSECTHSYPTDSTVTLAAKAAKGSVFKTWAGDCKGDEKSRLKAYKNPTCAVKLDHTLRVKAIFVSKGGGGGGGHGHHGHHGHKHGGKHHGHKHHGHKHHGHKHHGH